MKFHDDEPIECENCEAMVYPSDEYYTWDNRKFCCKDCVKSAMFEKFENDVNSHYLYTAEEYEADYGDMKYAEMRGK